MASCDFLSFSMFPRFPALTNIYSLLLPNNVPSNEYVPFRLSIHQLMGICVVASWAAADGQCRDSTRVRVSAWTCTSVSPGHKRRSGNAGSYGSSMFNILRNCQTFFQSSCATLHVHQQCVWVLMSAPLWCASD